jgi:hypothetical protein
MGQNSADGKAVTLDRAAKILPGWETTRILTKGRLADLCGKRLLVVGSHSILLGLMQDFNAVSSRSGRESTLPPDHVARACAL